MSADQRLGRVLWRVGLPIALGSVLLAILFSEEVKAALSVWRGSTAYNHCFLVLPVAAWLLYERRHAPGLWPARPSRLAPLLILPLTVAWFSFDQLGIMEARQFVVLAFFFVLVLCVLGLRSAYAVRAPLLYLCFLVPFGSFLTPTLQLFTTTFIDRGLDVLRVPHFVTGHEIEIPRGTFYVAQACAGLRFLTASFSFGVLYSLVMFRSPTRRTLFIVASVVVPVLANGFRALGIVYAGYLLGDAEAAAADHLIYGWLFFSVVVLLLSFAGLPFREDARQAAGQVVRPAAPPLQVSTPLVLLLGLFCLLGPAAKARIEMCDGGFVPSALPVPAGCETASSTQRVTGQAAAVTVPFSGRRQVFRCAGGQLRMTVVAMPIAVGVKRLEAAEHELLDDGDTDQPVSLLEDVDASGWYAAASPARDGGVVMHALWIDGQAASDGLRTRLMVARDGLTAGDHLAVLAMISADNLGQARQLLRLANQSGLSAFLASYSRAKP